MYGNRIHQLVVYFTAGCRFKHPILPAVVINGVVFIYQNAVKGSPLLMVRLNGNYMVFSLQVKIENK